MVTNSERQFADFMTRVKKRYEGKWQRIIGQAIRKDMKPFIEAVKTEGALIGLYRLDFLAFPNLIKALNDLWVGIYPIEAERMYRQLKRVKAGLGEASEDWLSVLRTFLDLNVNARRFLAITETQRKRMLEILENGLSTDQSIEEIVSQLEGLGLNTRRARLIARSEANSAVNAGHYQGAKSQRYVMRKKWVAALDIRTRGAVRQDKTDHYDLNGVEVAMDDFFVDDRSLANMLYPGDSANGAGAGDICNCRCSVLFVPQRDAEGRLIRNGGQQIRPTLQRPANYNELPRIEKVKTDKRIIAERLGMNEEDFDVKIGKTKNNTAGDVRVVKNSEGVYVMGKNVLLSEKLSDDELSMTLAHEMRHIWQSQTKGYYITNEGIFWDNKLYMTTRQYNTILNAVIRAKTKEDWEKATAKYNALPWEMDANDFMRMPIKLFSTVGIIDLIELPAEFQN